MKAEPARQQLLLQLQDLDTSVAQADHRLRTLPEHVELQEAQRRVAELESEEIKVRTAHDDAAREVAKADADVQLVRDRAARDQARLDAGTGSPKDLQALQHELESLARRQSALEDVELEVMERAEGLEKELHALQQALEKAREQAQTIADQRDRRVAAVEEERAALMAPRAGLVDEVGVDLVALYEKIRASSGSGAAPLQQRRCGGCRLELNQVELGRLRAAPADEVLRCEECRRILVRTPESGL